MEEKNTSSVKKYTHIFCVTPKQSFDTTLSISFKKDILYHAIGVTLCESKNIREKVVIFNDTFQYVVYSPMIAKKFFEYVQEKPVSKAKEEQLITKLNEINHIHL